MQQALRLLPLALLFCITSLDVCDAQVLSTPALREVHDRELAQAELRSVLTYQDELDVDEMESEAGDEVGE